jgi:hypothetical protein
MVFSKADLSFTILFELPAVSLVVEKGKILIHKSKQELKTCFLKQ